MYKISLTSIQLKIDRGEIDPKSDEAKPLDISDSVFIEKTGFEQLCVICHQMVNKIMSDEQLINFTKISLLGICIYRFFNIRVKLYNDKILCV